MTRRKALLTLGLSGFALLCGTLMGCRKRMAELPRFGEIGDFALTDQSGQRKTNREFEGKVWIAAFIFTRCPSVCPVITRRMREIQRVGMQRGLRFWLTSFSVDPDFDTPQVLTRYAHEYGADLSSWSFLTGDYAVVKRTAEHSFKIALEGRADAAAPGYGIMHGSHLVLVDEQLEIRGFYPSSDDDAIARLINDAERLQK